jgi:hypothetical protein
MLWIGGGQGAGKTTLSCQLSRAEDLPLHRIDLWPYYHHARLPAGDSLDEQLACSRTGSRSGAGVWLLPDPARTRAVREERLAHEETFAGRPAAGRSRASRQLQRDSLPTERIRASAAQRARPVIEVPPSPDWPTITAAIESALAQVLRSAPRLAPGSELSRQRRYENKAAERQGRLWMQNAGLAVMPAYPFGCECGRSGCRATWMATPDAYAARTDSDGHLIAHDRAD